MIDLGTTLYYVRINSNVFTREKIQMTDAEGNVWHRYDNEQYTYSITPLTVIGRMVATVDWIGEPRCPTPETTYYMEDDSEWDESDLNRTDYLYSGIYTSLTLAESRVQLHKELHK